MQLPARRFDGSDRADTDFSDLPTFCDRKLNMAKDFKEGLILMIDCVLCANVFLERITGIEIDKTAWPSPSLLKEQDYEVYQ